MSVRNSATAYGGGFGIKDPAYIDFRLEDDDPFLNDLPLNIPGFSQDFSSESSLSSGVGSVCLMDTNVFRLQRIAQGLEKSGYAVDAFDKIDEALRSVINKQYDVLLLGYIGAEKPVIIQAIRESEYVHLQTVVVAALTYDVALKDALVNSGADIVISFYATDEEINENLAGALSRKHGLHNLSGGGGEASSGLSPNRGGTERGSPRLNPNTRQGVQGGAEFDLGEVSTPAAGHGHSSGSHDSATKDDPTKATYDPLLKTFEKLKDMSERFHGQDGGQKSLDSHDKQDSRKSSSLNLKTLLAVIAAIIATNLHHLG